MLWLSRHLKCPRSSIRFVARAWGAPALIDTKVRKSIQVGSVRSFSLDVIPAVLLPPAVFTGLLLTLWTYKCIMMVTFQNKIIYMPSIPPYSRSETVENYASQCRPVVWTEHDLRSTDGTKLKLLEGTVHQNDRETCENHIVVLYLQGNASSSPPRLPYLSSILKSLSQSGEKKVTAKAAITLVALSYRGFWKSRGSATQPGIELDVAAALQWLFDHYKSEGTTFIIWGQSIGAGAATVGMSNLCRDDPQNALRISGLLLETPFVNIRDMLVALYPQKFLPYRYLWPFLRSTWDSKNALERIGQVRPGLRVQILQAGDDEIVPTNQAPALEEAGKTSGLDISRKVIAGAYHTEIMARSSGRVSITRFLQSF